MHGVDDSPPALDMSIDGHSGLIEITCLCATSV
jgi:hypothetical protein